MFGEERRAYEVKITNLGPSCKCGMPHGVTYRVHCTCGYAKEIHDDYGRAEILRDAHEAGMGHKAV